jgi:DNA-binding HxlR family transcriptional regulator
MESNQLYPAELANIGKSTLKLVSSRGTMEILSFFCCSQKKVRFTELSRLFKHVSTKTLASRLKELEKDGILNRTAYNEIPPRVEYSMTEKGQSLALAVEPLTRWMIQWTNSNRTSAKDAERPNCACFPKESEPTQKVPNESRARKK